MSFLHESFAFFLGPRKQGRKSQVHRLFQILTRAKHVEKRLVFGERKAEE
jgi:hypothetical protein